METITSKQEIKAVLLYADPVTDAILAGLTGNGYRKYSAGFDEQMKNALPENVFHQIRELFQSKIGSYQSRVLKSIIKENQYTIVLYACQFENEEEVEVKVVFQKFPAGPLVSGLWFDSAKLRQ